MGIGIAVLCNALGYAGLSKSPLQHKFGQCND